MLTGKKILVTGGAGFVGSHLVERLVHDGNMVTVLDNYVTGSVENHIEGARYIEGHTKDIAALITEVPDLVYHLGEYARTEKSFEDIELVWDLNKVGTFAVLEFVRRCGARIIYAGSSTKFADGGEGRDQSPYAWTKATNTELVKNYAQWFGLDYAITYFYNVYGPREMAGPFGTLIRIFTELHRNGQPLTVVSPGTQTRNFTHVGDIVEGLVLVGERGSGDSYGIGSPEAFSILDVARMFGGEVLMMPERKGNRMTSGVDTEKTRALGWETKHSLTRYIEEVKQEIGEVKTKERRVLIFTTTFYPIAGAAEHALCDVMNAMPNVHFDIVTTKFIKDADSVICPVANATLYRVGNGTSFDKYLLPFFGASIARTLIQKHEYMFSWALFASYGALAALFSRGKKHTPLLITLADQRLGSIPWYARLLLRHILGSADQVYATDTREAQHALSLSKRTKLVRSIGSGDAFANQVRFAYSTMLLKRTQCSAE